MLVSILREHSQGCTAVLYANYAVHGAVVPRVETAAGGEAPCSKRWKQKAPARQSDWAATRTTLKAHARLSIVSAACTDVRQFRHRRRGRVGAQPAIAGAACRAIFSACIRNRLNNQLGQTAEKSAPLAHPALAGCPAPCLGFNTQYDRCPPLVLRTHAFHNTSIRDSLATGLR